MDSSTVVPSKNIGGLTIQGLVSHSGKNGKIMSRSRSSLLAKILGNLPVDDESQEIQLPKGWNQKYDIWKSEIRNVLLSFQDLSWIHDAFYIKMNVRRCTTWVCYIQKQILEKSNPSLSFPIFLMMLDPLRCSGDFCALIFFTLPILYFKIIKTLDTLPSSIITTI